MTPPEPGQSGEPTAKGSFVGLRHSDRAVMDEVCAVWNRDNEDFGVPWRWEVVRDDHPHWPWTMKRAG